MTTESFYSPGSLRRTAADVAAGRLSCVQAVERCLARAAVVEGSVKAFLHIDSEGALAQARDRDRARKAGRRRGALDGIGVAVKDIIDVAGMPTTAGSKVPPRRVAAQDADIVARLRAAGAIVLGKANTHEFASGATTPPTRNPTDLDRIAGGSSGGSAAAVAAGAALLGVGTDTGGSVRLPAALCGVAGLRPRSDTIGMGGIVPLAPEFDVWGLIAPSAADLDLVCSALGTDSTTPGATRLIVPRDLSATILDAHPDISRAFGAAIARATASGMQVAKADIADLREWRPPRISIQMQQALRTHRDAGWWPARREFYSEEVRINFEMAEAKASEPLDGARARLLALDHRIDALLSGDAVLCLPTVPVVAPRVQDIAQMPRRGEPRHPIIGLLACCTLPFSKANLASLTIPCGGDAAGIPIGLQLVATTDAAVLRAGMLLESAIAIASSVPATGAKE